MCRFIPKLILLCVCGFLISVMQVPIVWAQDFPVVTGGKPTTKLSWKMEGEAALLVVECRTGIDKVVLRPEKGKWLQSIRLQLQLQGLEHLAIRTEKHDLRFSVSSTAPHDVHCMLFADGKEQELRSDHPLFAEVKLRGEKASIPLREGYFEVTIPAAIFKDNPQKLAVEWIDFYR